jgi:hypothetical protein
MSALAIISLVLGILGLFTCGVTAIFGLILGILALMRVKGSSGTLTGGGMAIGGIVVSAFFTMMIPIFVLLFIPVLAAAKHRAQTIRCVDNEHQLARAVRLYADNNANHFPPAATWCDAIKDTVGSNTNIFLCPAASPGSRCDYAFNAALGGMDDSKVNPQTVLLFEADSGWDANGGVDLMATPLRHEFGRKCVVALADGSVEEVKASEVGTLRWNP